MLRINSTTTRAVTAFDVVGLFCIFGMPPYGFMPQKRRAHYNTLHVYCQDNAIFFLQKKQTKKTAAQAFTGAAIYPKMQGNHPLCLHSTHTPHKVKHFLAKKTTAQAFTRAAIFQTMKGNHPLTPSFYPPPSQSQAHPRKKKAAGRAHRPTALPRTKRKSPLRLFQH